MENLVTILIAVAIAFCILLLCRELNCWYLKINERRDLLRMIVDNQRTIIRQLQMLNADEEEQKKPTTKKPTVKKTIPVRKVEENGEARG